jgi:hypothetical protein
MNKYSVSIGRECPTDDTLIISNGSIQAELLIEDDDWKLASLFMDMCESILDNGTNKGWKSVMKKITDSNKRKEKRLWKLWYPSCKECMKLADLERGEYRVPYPPKCKEHR